MSTGITLSDLCYGVFFESFKSNVVNMQSIGRGLGLSDIKDKYRLFDIVDCFENTITNKIFLQGLERIKIYKSDFNKHKYFIKEFNIDNNSDYNEKYKVAYQKYLDLQKEEKPKKKEKKKTEVESFMDDLFG
jgi:type I site-specific restriction endonuclease